MLRKSLIVTAGWFALGIGAAFAQARPVAPEPDADGTAATDMVKRHADAAPDESYDGVGGPIEEPAAYPPCGGTVQDSCIQDR